MKIELQVCTLQQAEKLKKMGVNQRLAHYFWDKSDGRLYRSVDGSAADLGCFAAFSVAELGVMLTDELDENQMTCMSSYNPHDGTWICFVDQWDEEKGRSVGLADMEGEGDTEAEARAWALIYHLEKSVVTVEEVNQRLSA